jgi:hypothetical protein
MVNGELPKDPPEPVKRTQLFRVTFLMWSSALRPIVRFGEENPTGKVK